MQRKYPFHKPHTIPTTTTSFTTFFSLFWMACVLSDACCWYWWPVLAPCAQSFWLSLECFFLLFFFWRESELPAAATMPALVNYRGMIMLLCFFGVFWLWACGVCFGSSLLLVAYEFSFTVVKIAPCVLVGFGSWHLSCALICRLHFCQLGSLHRGWIDWRSTSLWVYIGCCANFCFRRWEINGRLSPKALVF